jgi:UDP-glucose 4-epimerase
MKKILLTGAKGFIGSYFKEKYKNIYEIKEFSFLNDNFEELKLDNIDTVVHLSALVHQMGGATREEYFTINVDNTLKLVQKAQASGVKQFIFMSTVKVYGEESDTIYTEKSPCNPQDDYGLSKLEAEKKLMELETDSFIVSIVRTPIVYGRGVKANILNLTKLIERVPILPFYNIQNRRSMVYIGNLCAIISQIISFEKSAVFLASDDEVLSTSEFIKLIAKSKKVKVYLVYIPFFETLLKYIKPSFYKRLYGSLEVDNSYSKRILDFKNPYSVEEGIYFMLKGEK